ncbi:MAG: DUF2794 domain-containing protein [Hyphomonadaceae bacterium]
MQRNVSHLQKPALRTAFQRDEMTLILNTYGHLVASGEARDYAIGMYPDKAIFAIFRHAAEQPSWRIEKIPQLARKQGMYVIYGMAGQVLRRGHELSTVLRLFQRKRFAIVK